MGTVYTTAVGAPPDPGSLQFFKWIDDLVAYRLAECPLARTTTYYFSNSSGNDSTGVGTEANPWKTIAKAQAVIDAAASNADLRLRFKRGDTWEETTGLSITKDNVTVDDYGTGAKPVFSLFTLKYSSSGWALASGDRYTRSETNTIGWVRDQADRFTPYIKVSSTAEVESTPKSWYWASNTLHINAGAGVNPNTKNLEAVIANTAIGIQLDGDKGRVENIRGDGWGIDPVTPHNQKYFVKITGRGTKANLARGCEAYYSSTHNIAYDGGSSPGNNGGIATFIDCKAGFPIQGPSGETLFNSFVGEGGQETIFYNCETKYGTLPEGTGTYTARGTGVYHHTSGVAGQEGALHIVYGHKTPRSAYPIQTGVNAAGTKPATTLTDARAFNIFERKEFPLDGVAAGSTQPVAPPNMVNINCIWQVRPNQAAGALTTTAQTGWAINCILDIDMALQTAILALWNTTSDNNTAKLYHCLIYFRGNKTIGVGATDYDCRTTGTSFATQSELKNCIVVLVDPGGTNNVALNGDSTKMVNNAYTVDTWTDSTGAKRYSIDTNRVEFSSEDAPYITQSKLTSAHPLYQKGTPLNIGYDINLNLRGPTPSIGPFDSFKVLDLGRVTNLTASIASSTSITLSWTAASGLVNITDHEVKYRVVGSTSWATLSHALNPGNSITVTGLIAKTEYEFSVAPISAWGTGNPEFVKATPYAGSDLKIATLNPKVK